MAQRRIWFLNVLVQGADGRVFAEGHTGNAHTQIEAVRAPAVQNYRGGTGFTLVLRTGVTISSTSGLSLHCCLNLSCYVRLEVREELVDALNEDNESVRALTKALPQTDGEGADLKRRRMFVYKLKKENRMMNLTHILDPRQSSSPKQSNGKNKIKMLRAKLKDAEGQYANKRYKHAPASRQRVHGLRAISCC